MLLILAMLGEVNDCCLLMCWGYLFVLGKRRSEDARLAFCGRQANANGPEAGTKLKRITAEDNET